MSFLRQAQDKSEPFDGLRIDSAKNLSDPSNNEILRLLAPQRVGEPFCRGGLCARPYHSI